MSILLEDYEIRDAVPCIVGDTLRIYCEIVAEAQAKKILIELQAIYNLPDGGMFHDKMGEFIKELKEEVNE